MDFARDRLRVCAPKTKQSRTIPILAEVSSALLRAHTDAPAGSEFVFSRRLALPVLRRVIEGAIDDAELTAWPKLFQNLRASFATDCVRKLPANQAAAVLGHSRAVAAEHYWTTDETDFDALQKALQQGAELNGIGGNSASEKSEKPADSLHQVASEGTDANRSMGAAGFEPAKA